jgi:hypothetical protein
VGREAASEADGGAAGGAAGGAGSEGGVRARGRRKGDERMLGRRALMNVAATDSPLPQRRHAIRPRMRRTQWGPRRRACTAKTKDRPPKPHRSDRPPIAVPKPPNLRAVCPLGMAAPAILVQLPLAAGTMVTGTLARSCRVLWRSAGSGPPPLRYAARIPTRPRRLASLARTRCSRIKGAGGGQNCRRYDAAALCVYICTAGMYVSCGEPGEVGWGWWWGVGGEGTIAADTSECQEHTGGDVRGTLGI